MRRHTRPRRQRSANWSARRSISLHKLSIRWRSNGGSCSASLRASAVTALIADNPANSGHFDQNIRPLPFSYFRTFENSQYSSEMAKRGVYLLFGPKFRFKTCNYQNAEYGYQGLCRRCQGFRAIARLALVDRRLCVPVEQRPSGRHSALHEAGSRPHLWFPLTLSISKNSNA